MKGPVNLTELCDSVAKIIIICDSVGKNYNRFSRNSVKVKIVC